ncbi:hypothetical protein LBMAG25_06270 [Bacteroidota bacterium]|nr:hypothetical protein LBMAG25_06270 [Bacteroidota bacterium]
MAQNNLNIQLTPVYYAGNHGVSCQGASNGSISATPAGGVAPYTYIWSNGATTENIQNLNAGNYSITVSDADNSTATQFVTLTQPNPLQSSLSSPLYGVYQISVYGAQAGQIDLDVQGGTAPYSFLWSNGNTSQRLYNLGADNYTVTVSDANGCTASDNKQLTQPQEMQISAIEPSLKSNGKHLSCEGTHDGEIHLTITGGVPPYRYNWSNGSLDAVNTTAAAGTNSVVVTDAHGATVQASTELTTPDAIYIELVLSEFANGYATSAYAHNDGSVQVSVQGGSAPYSYLWSNDATTQNLQQLYGGNYELTVTDMMGCRAEEVAKLKEPPFPGWKWDGNEGLSGNNFIGTLNDAPLLFKTNDQSRLQITGSGEVNVSSLAGNGNGILYADEAGQLKKWDGITAVQGLLLPDFEVLGNCGRIVNPWQELNDGNHHIVKCPVEDNVGIGISTTPRAKLHLKNKWDYNSKNLMLILQNDYSTTGNNDPTIQFNNGNYTDVEGFPATTSWNVSGIVSGYPALFKISYREQGYKNFEDNNIFMIKYNGQVGINLKLNDPNNDFPQDENYKLAVNGKIICEELRVQKSEEWPDYVFDKEYSLMPLDSLEKFIKEHKHLPSIPNAEQVNVNGINVSEMNTLLLKKIEELTLYIIELKKAIND